MIGNLGDLSQGNLQVNRGVPVRVLGDYLSLMCQVGFDHSEVNCQVIAPLAHLLPLCGGTHGGGLD